MNSHDAVVIGGGQSGLAAAQALTAQGLQPVVLEAGPEPVGSWPHYYDSLTLFSPARYSALPGMPFPGDPERYPHRDEVVDYLRRYAETLDADIRTGQRVTEVTKDNSGFAVTVADGTSLEASTVIAASGGFGNPYRPPLPGLDKFTGTVQHAAEYRSPEQFHDQRVIVVGAGNSAVQIAVELARHSRVTLATRKAVRYSPQRPLGRDLHFWLARTKLDILPVGRWLPAHFSTPVLDTGVYRATIDAGRPDRRPVFSGIDGTEITWQDGQREDVDAIVLATGYRPDLSYLTPLNAFNEAGRPVHDRGVSSLVLGLGYIGLEWQRSLSSATLRGVGRDARQLAKRLTDTAAQRTGPAPF